MRLLRPKEERVDHDWGHEEAPNHCEDDEGDGKGGGIGDEVDHVAQHSEEAERKEEGSSAQLAVRWSRQHSARLREDAQPVEAPHLHITLRCLAQQLIRRCCVVARSTLAEAEARAPLRWGGGGPRRRGIRGPVQ